MKRLTDAQVTNGYADGRGAPNAQSPRKDHLQARDDRQLLVSLLSRSAAFYAGSWSPAEREQWETIREEVAP